jgi:thioredoxin reductase (NADPH)
MRNIGPCRADLSAAAIVCDQRQMAQSAPPSFSARHEQMFPTLAGADIERLRRFGEPRSYKAGERVVRAGEVGPGLILVLSGRLETIQGRGPTGPRRS